MFSTVFMVIAICSFSFFSGFHMIYSQLKSKKALLASKVLLVSGIISAVIFVILRILNL